MAERMSPEMRAQPGYEGYLNDRVASLPEVLRDSGSYETLMAGKWHLGLTPDRSPQARGFDRSFALLGGCHNHYGFEPAYEDRKTIPRIAAVLGRMYSRDGRAFGPNELPADFYSSDSFTDELLGYLHDREARKGARSSHGTTSGTNGMNGTNGASETNGTNGTTDGSNDPPAFFAYLPFSAPHWPLQAPQETIAHYAGMYDDGPEVLRQKRLAALKKGGLVAADAVPAPVISLDEDGHDTATWEQMTPEQRRASARRMEVYAGMVERMDANIGRVLDALKASGELDRTLVLFFSDNGAEGAQFEAWPLTAGGDMDAYVARYHDNSLENLGARDSFAWYGARWASASTAPGRLFKMFTSEGGIRVPLVLRYPPLVSTPGAIDHAFGTVMDIMPTILDLAGVTPPGTSYRGRPVAPIAGRSWLPHLRSLGTDAPAATAIHPVDHVTGWELFGRRAVRQGSWKAIFIPAPFGPARWQLFNVLTDPGETEDRGDALPDKLQEMIALYENYCKQNGVIDQSGSSRDQWSDAVQ